VFLPDDGFKPVSREATIGWGLFYALFLLYAAVNTSGFLFLDHANLMIHEAGHALFGWAGYYTQILGGTLGQLIVPALCVLAFTRRGETTAVAFCAFWGFENLLYVATYMADARTSALPLVGSDESDWTILFTHWGLLQRDRTIAAWTRSAGWLGMLATVAWLVWMHLVTTASPSRHPTATHSRDPYS
jgi:hypothetical protein